MEQLRKLLSQGRKALLPTGDAISRIPIVDMLAHNWHLGLTCFGGPAVHFQIFRELFVNKYKWIDNTHYDEMFALCQALTGAASTKLHFAINMLRYGFWTGLAAFVLWSAPMAIAALGLALGIGSVGDELPVPVYALLSGLNSATVGIIALAAVQLSETAITDTLTRILVFLGATAGMLYNALWYFPVLMISGSVVSMAWDLRVSSWLRRMRRRRTTTQNPQPGPDSQNTAIPIRPAQASGVSISVHSAQERQEPSAPLTGDTPQRLSYPPALRSWKIGCLIVAAFFLTFITVMVCRALYSGENRAFDLFANLYLAGTIIFGGGPVVIPLLREYVVGPGWVSPRDFLLGLAITQSLPGPNFNFAVYLGALAVKGTGLSPVLGALLAWTAIFLPGLWIMTGFVGIWTSVRKSQVVRSCLRGIHATAVGLVFTAVYRLFEIGYLDAEVKNGGSLSRDPWWVVIVATSFVGGKYFRVAPPVACALGGVMGLMWYGVTKS